ncbi:putative PB1 domain, Zinc finger, ZZ-type, UBA-like superfamily, immunoglobulin-like protein [Dioscorea sansibarensis]
MTYQMGSPFFFPPAQGMEISANDWNLVIKVNYHDILKRFGAHVSGKRLDHDMTRLKRKIIDLFKFRADDNFTLTYIDEDGDTVTLDTDDELHDAAVSQRLNPLRINVLMKSHADEKFKPSSSTSSKSPNIQTKQPQASVISEALNSLPEPLRSTLSKLSEDLLSKATSSSPAIAEFVEHFSKLGLANVNQFSQGASGESSGPNINASKIDKPSNDSPAGHAFSSPPNAASHITESSHEKHGSGNVEKSAGAKLSTSADINRDNVPQNQHAFGDSSVDDLLSSIWTTANIEPGRVLYDGKSASGSQPAIPAARILEHTSSSDRLRTPEPSLQPTNVASKGFIGGASSQFHPGSTSTTPDCLNPPPNRINIPSHGFLASWLYPKAHPYRRGHSYIDSSFRTFHRGVQCDNCGMHPIIGPRFKSNVKEDYDLCSICFAQIGNDADYTKIDRVPYRSPRLFKESYNPHSRSRSSSHGFHGCGTRSSRAKLDSRFIQDVTVLDGTIISPSTPFTKIWRMRNNGTFPWFVGTQLVWIGGDQLGNQASVGLEIPKEGYPVDAELDVAVDFTAPSSPGRYISYWKMASPSGQKFGQRVWLLIQVDNSRPNSSSSHADINLNLPPDNNYSNGQRVIIDVNAHPSDAVSAGPDVTNINIREVFPPFFTKIPIHNVEPATVAELLRATNEPTQPMPKASPYPIIEPTQPMPKASSPISYPIIEFPSPSSSSSTAHIGSSSKLDVDNNPVENTLLKELEEMGFKQIDLNKEVLRLNEYDLELSVDDLCGFAEWDPLLNELQDMGFSDKETNKKLLIKNGGSIKRVVLDLISGEKAE